MAVMMELSGAGEATTRAAGSSWLLELRKNTLTGTKAFGCVVVVVGGCGFRRSKGTFDEGMGLGAFCVGMAQPAATKATTRKAGTAMRRLTPHHPPARSRSGAPGA